MNREQDRRFRQAVVRKAEQAEAASRNAAQNPRQGPSVTLDRSGEEQPNIAKDGPQDVSSVRDKSSGKGKKTADKWNQ